jgi:hypothetical protein
VIIELIGGIMNVDTSGKFIARIIYKMLWMKVKPLIFVIIAIALLLYASGDNLAVLL